MDEKTQSQALDRTQRSLPMVGGRARTMTHDYKRNGTTDLFAALNVLTGNVIGRCWTRHRHEEFLRFLRTIDGHPQGLQIHMIVDNYRTHIHRLSNSWPAQAFSPALHTNLVVVAEPGGTWFRDLTDKNRRRCLWQRS